MNSTLRLLFCVLHLSLQFKNFWNDTENRFLLTEWKFVIWCIARQARHKSFVVGLMLSHVKKVFFLTTQENQRLITKLKSFVNEKCGKLFFFFVFCESVPGRGCLSGLLRFFIRKIEHYGNYFQFLVSLERRKRFLWRNLKPIAISQWQVNAQLWLRSRDMRGSYCVF